MCYSHSSAKSFKKSGDSSWRRRTFAKLTARARARWWSSSYRSPTFCVRRQSLVSDLCWCVKLVGPLPPGSEWLLRADATYSNPWSQQQLADFIGRTHSTCVCVCHPTRMNTLQPFAQRSYKKLSRTGSKVRTRCSGLMSRASRTVFAQQEKRDQVQPQVVAKLVCSWVFGGARRECRATARGSGVSRAVRIV